MSPSLHLPHPHHHQPQPTTSTKTASHSPPASPKGQHYAETLDTIRRLALWTSQAPALAKGAVNYNAVQDSPEPITSTNGVLSNGMEWNEVLRKFRKHNPNRTGQSHAPTTYFRSRESSSADARIPQSPPPPLAANGPSDASSRKLARRQALPILLARWTSRRRSCPPTGPQPRKLSPTSRRL